jgi:hypothetical protein
MATAVIAQPADPIVSTGSVPSACRDQPGDRWLKAGTPAVAEVATELAAQTSRPSKQATVRRTDPLITRPS